MNANADEPEFCRLWLPAVGQWVRTFRAEGAGLIVDLTNEPSRAGVFCSPSPEAVAALSKRVSRAEKVPATFADWIAADFDRVEQTTINHA